MEETFNTLGGQMTHFGLTGYLLREKRIEI